MKFNTFVIAASVAALTFGAIGTASAEWEPKQPIKIIVGFAPGGGTDATARLITSAAQEFFRCRWSW